MSGHRVIGSVGALTSHHYQISKNGRRDVRCRVAPFEAGKMADICLFLSGFGCFGGLKNAQILST